MSMIIAVTVFWMMADDDADKVQSSLNSAHPPTPDLLRRTLTREALDLQAKLYGWVAGEAFLIGDATGDNPVIEARAGINMVRPLREIPYAERLPPNCVDTREGKPPRLVEPPEGD